MRHPKTPNPQPSGREKTLLVIGGTSDIGRAVADAHAASGWTVSLAARDFEGARRNAQDIQTRHGTEPVAVHRLDILDTETFDAFVDALGPLPKRVVCVVGLLGDQGRAQNDPAHAKAVMRTNFEGPALLLEMLAGRFGARGHGMIVAVSSVAGDRGRASNYVYGASKAALSAYLSGLRNRLTSSGVRVVTIKPGFVRTSMTAGMKLPELVTASPETVAKRVLALRSSGGGDIIYVLRVWRAIMGIIGALPEPIFKRLNL